jgi:hypothetical protein
VPLSKIVCRYRNPRFPSAPTQGNLGHAKLCRCLTCQLGRFRRKCDSWVSVSSVAVEVAVGAALFGGVGYCWFGVIRGAARRERAVLKEHARATRAHYAAVEAGEDDPIFSPDAIEQTVAEVVALANDLWRTGTSGISTAAPMGDSSEPGPDPGSPSSARALR